MKQRYLCDQKEVVSSHQLPQSESLTVRKFVWTECAHVLEDHFPHWSPMQQVWSYSTWVKFCFQECDIIIKIQRFKQRFHYMNRRRWVAITGCHSILKWRLDQSLCAKVQVLIRICRVIYQCRVLGNKDCRAWIQSVLNLSRLFRSSSDFRRVISVQRFSIQRFNLLTRKVSGFKCKRFRCLDSGFDASARFGGVRYSKLVISLKSASLFSAVFSKNLGVQLAVDRGVSSLSRHWSSDMSSWSACSEGGRQQQGGTVSRNGSAFTCIVGLAHALAKSCLMWQCKVFRPHTSCFCIDCKCCSCNQIKSHEKRGISII